MAQDSRSEASQMGYVSVVMKKPFVMPSGMVETPPTFEAKPMIISMLERRVGVVYNLGFLGNLRFHASTSLQTSLARRVLDCLSCK